MGAWQAWPACQGQTPPPSRSVLYSINTGCPTTTPAGATVRVLSALEGEAGVEVATEAVYSAAADPSLAQAAQQAAQQLAARLAAPTFLEDTWPGASVRDVQVTQLLAPAAAPPPPVVEPPQPTVSLTFTAAVPGVTLQTFSADEYLQAVAQQAPGEQPGASSGMCAMRLEVPA